MLKPSSALPLLLITFVAAGCASKATVQSDFDAGTDFSSYRTYSFISDKPLISAAPGVSPLLQGRLIAATQRGLDAKGYRYIDNREQADFVISFTVGARDKIRVNSYPSTYRGAYMGGWAAPYHSEVDVRNYTEGTLAIDAFDVAERKPVWHGWAVKSITMSERQNPEPLINDIVDAILKEFPPG